MWTRDDSIFFESVDTQNPTAMERRDERFRLAGTLLEALALRAESKLECV